MAKDDFNMSRGEFFSTFPDDKIPEEYLKEVKKYREDNVAWKPWVSVPSSTLKYDARSSDNSPSIPTIADGGGLRFSEGKPRYDLIPPEFMEALANHYAQGARKYADRNWERGMSWCQCFRPLMSHAWKWFRGEKYDEDPAMPGYKAHHMVAVAWNAIALYVYETRQIGKDDRPICIPKEKE